MFVAKVRKPPDISKTDSKAQARENELDGVVPLEPPLGLGRILTRHTNLSSFDNHLGGFLRLRQQDLVLRNLITSFK